MDKENNLEQTQENNENLETIEQTTEEKEVTHDKLSENNIVDEVKDSFLDYSMSVIAARALPDLRDGLKPVHRRILWSMYESG